MLKQVLVILLFSSVVIPAAFAQQDSCTNLRSARWDEQQERYVVEYVNGELGSCTLSGLRVSAAAQFIAFDSRGDSVDSGELAAQQSYYPGYPAVRFVALVPFAVTPWAGCAPVVAHYDLGFAAYLVSYDSATLAACSGQALALDGLNAVQYDELDGDDVVGNGLLEMGQAYALRGFDVRFIASERFQIVPQVAAPTSTPSATLVPTVTPTATTVPTIAATEVPTVRPSPTFHYLPYLVANANTCSCPRTESDYSSHKSACP